MSRDEKMKNRYYEMKAHALKIFRTYYPDKFQKLCRTFFLLSIFLHLRKVKEFIKETYMQKYDFFQKNKIDV